MRRRIPRPALLLAGTLCTLAAPALAQPTPATPGAEAAPQVDARRAAELGRLAGQRVRLVDASPGDSPGRAAGYVIEDVAREGAPLVGVVEQRPGGPWLAGADGVAYRLAGVLARPRIAGPGYKVWVLGRVFVQRGENVLVARRIGILAPPWQPVTGSR